MLPSRSVIAGSAPLDERSLKLRALAVRALAGGNRGHVGSTMSLIEIIRVLYDDILRLDATRPEWPDRDRCILSKGHGCIALYVLLVDKGFIPVSYLDSFCRTNGVLGGHPERGKVPGVEASTGSLGHGLSIGVGMGLAARMQKRKSRVFVIMGDGEINEGSVWEAAMCAGKHALSNLCAIVDYNRIQSAGSISEIQELEPLADKWRSFGFATIEVDGHDVDSMREAFGRLPFESGKPSAVICHTVKGRGIPFAEDDPKWHHQSNLDPKVLEQMFEAVGGRP